MDQPLTLPASLSAAFAPGEVALVGRGLDLDGQQRQLADGQLGAGHGAEAAAAHDTMHWYLSINVVVFQVLSR